MSHLGERITDYVFEELSPAEMAEARTHVAQCGECRMAVEHFQRTRLLLQSAPDVDPPRSAALVFGKRPGRTWTWRWIAPMSAAAVLVLVVALFVPVQVQYRNSQFTIAFGKPQPSQPKQPSAETQNAEAIQQLQDQVKFLKGLQDGQQREIYATAAYVQQLAQRSSTVGD